MEIRLGWNELTELVARQKIELGGDVTLTLDRPKGSISISRPSNSEWQETPLRDPEAEDARLVLKTLRRRLAEAESSNDFAPGEFASLLWLAYGLEGLLPEGER